MIRRQDIIRAESKHITNMIPSMVESFDDDPVLNWFVRQDQQRSQAFQLIFQYFFRRSVHKKHVFTAGDFSGSAIWYPPGQWRGGVFEQLLNLPLIIRACGLSRIPGIIKALNILENNHPSTPHYYLHFIGVSAQARGKGVGGCLMREVLKKCDEDGIPAYLENSKETNIGFYQGYGFEVKRCIKFEEGAPDIWLMWRNPG